MLRASTQRCYPSGEVLCTSPEQTGHARFARVSKSSLRKVGCFDERTVSARQSRALAEMSFDDYLAPAARLSRAALRARGEAVTDDNHHGHARHRRACPVSSPEMRSIFA